MQDAITSLGPDGFGGAYVQNDEMMTGALEAMQEAGLDPSYAAEPASNRSEGRGRSSESSRSSRSCRSVGVSVLTRRSVVTDRRWFLLRSRTHREAVTGLNPGF